MLLLLLLHAQEVIVVYSALVSNLFYPVVRFLPGRICFLTGIF